MKKIFLEPKPDWAETLKIRGAVLDELTRRGFSSDNAEMGAMVATELSENAIKYGYFGPEDHFTVEIEGDRTDLTVRVRHPIAGESTPNVTRLKAMINWIKQFKNPEEAYMERVGAIAARDRKPGQKQRGLGLVRIAYEGQATLDCTCADGYVSISARCVCS